jgi:hypothetical protein
MSARRARQGNEIVVVGVRGNASLNLRIGKEPAYSPHSDREGGSLLGVHVLPQLLPPKHVEEFIQKVWTRHELELSFYGGQIEGGRSSGGGEEGGDEDPGIEDRSKHLAAASLPCGPELPVSEARGFLLGKVHAVPNLLEDAQAEILPKSLLEDLVVSPPCSGGLHLGRAKELLVQVHGGLRSRHAAILTERWKSVNASRTWLPRCGTRRSTLPAHV